MKRKSREKGLEAVYIVDEYEPPGNKPYVWRIVSIPVKSSSDRQIRLASANSAVGYRLKFEPHALGRIFFAKPEEAVTAFIRNQHKAAERAGNAIKEAHRALAWVEAAFPDVKVTDE